MNVIRQWLISPTGQGIYFSVLLYYVKYMYVLVILINNFLLTYLLTADIDKIKHHLVDTPRPVRAQLGVSRLMPNFASLWPGVVKPQSWLLL